MLQIKRLKNDWSINQELDLWFNKILWQLIFFHKNCIKHTYYVLFIVILAPDLRSNI